MHKLDAWLLNRFDAAAHWLGVKTGKSCFSFARWCAHTAAVLYTIVITFRLQEAMKESIPNASWIIFTLLVGVAMLWYPYDYIRKSDRAEDRLRSGRWTMNPLRVRLYIPRTFTIIIVSIEVSFLGTDLGVKGVIRLIFWIFDACALYFLSCNTPPPRKDEQRVVSGRMQPLPQQI